MEVSPLVIQEARCMFEELIVNRKRQLVALNYFKKHILYFIYIVIAGIIYSYLKIKYRSYEEGTYERGYAEGYYFGSKAAGFIGSIIWAVWMSYQYNKQLYALELEISSAEKLNIKESIEEVKRLNELRQKTVRKWIPLVAVLFICLILGTIVGVIESTTSDCSPVNVTSSNGTLGNSSTVVNVL